MNPDQTEKNAALDAAWVAYTSALAADDAARAAVGIAQDALAEAEYRRFRASEALDAAEKRYTWEAAFERERRAARIADTDKVTP